MDIAGLLNFEDDDAERNTEEGETGYEVLDEGNAGVDSDRPAASTPTDRGKRYVDKPIGGSGLLIIREREVQAAYKERGELGLFSREFRDSLHLWTNKMLNDIGKPEATVYEIDAYIGLEIAKSFNPATEMKELWSKTLFMGRVDYVEKPLREHLGTIPDSRTRQRSRRASRARHLMAQPPPDETNPREICSDRCSGWGR
ncbi:hypothetical protein PHMEG_0009118 [Phytophthora megakarya]|uniref:PiggyBac transposable element-derived protein domain-containing protein n=1 Tax=Phytophthora megakarya TaxID=4795 RepID=A0A225WGZ2_9STRA|nr:hypothetical protein PHMEG_0009118 [Phytophthora megakarya]